MNIRRLRVTLSGGVMGSGVATHYFDSSTTAGQSLYKGFWTSCASVMSGGVTITVPDNGEEFDSVTGALVGVWSQGTPGTITGGGTGSYPGGVGACVGWNTSGIHAGRKVRGRTFIVPLALNQYDNDGSLATGAITTINTAAATMLSGAANKHLIWARPRPGVPGEAYIITGGLVKDHVSWLKSRR